MAYTNLNFKSKAALKRFAEDNPDTPVKVHQPGPFGPDVPDGHCTLEGPHFPEPHRWYASCTVKDNTIVPNTIK